jgi:hypothetical protein
MTTRSFAAVLGLILCLGATSAAAQNSFESVNYPGYFIRHAYSLGEITRINSDLDRKDGTFVLKPALSGPQGAVSFESVNYPNHFLRHQNFRVKLHLNDGSDLFNKDASFIPRPGLAGTGISYESVNFPGRFLRHRDYHLWVEDNDGSDLFRKDASFQQRGPLYVGKIPCSVIQGLPFTEGIPCE